MQIYSLPSIDYLRLRFHLKALHDCDLPAWKGSLLRGAFGHALRRTACTMNPGQLCENCMLRSHCSYTRIFETFITEQPPPFLKGLDTSPRRIKKDASLWLKKAKKIRSPSEMKESCSHQLIEHSLAAVMMNNANPVLLKSNLNEYYFKRAE